MVVDLWGGWADEASTVPWTENTITCDYIRNNQSWCVAHCRDFDRGDQWVQCADGQADIEESVFHFRLKGQLVRGGLR